MRTKPGRAHPRVNALHPLEDAEPPAQQRFSMRGGEGMSGGP
jgi:hypothetical protein